MTIFVMHIRTQHCHCGNNETISTLYQAEEVARSGLAQKLLPCSSIGPNDPVRKVVLPLIQTPVCAACVDDSRATRGHDVYANWQETLKRKYAPAPATTSPKPPKAEPSLDDIA